MVIIDNQALIAEFKNLISNGFIQVFVWIVLGDIATGICKGIYREEGNSTKGLPGLIKHLLVVCLVIVTYPYLKIMGFSSIADGFILHCCLWSFDYRKLRAARCSVTFLG